MTIPATPAELTADWLTAALRDAGAIRESVVTDVTFEVIGADRGFTGVVARLQIDYDRCEPGQPATLVAKFPMAQHQGSTYRDMQQVSPEQARRYWGRCAREVQFYRELAAGADLAPRSFGAWADETTQGMLLLLEDLSAGEPGDALRGCSIEQAGLVVDRMAHFHARWWGQPTPVWLPRWGSDPAAMAARFQQQLDAVLDRYGARIPATVARLAREIASRYEPMLRDLAARSATIIHGDLHLDNLMFGGAKGVTLLDWQSVAVGPVVVDLGLFLVGSLSVADRRTAEFDLLGRFHQMLVEGGVGEYALNDLIDDYYRSIAWQLAGIVGWLARVDLETLAGRERALVDAIFTPGQVFAACADHAERLTTLADRSR